MDSLLIDDIINYACERHKLRLLRTRVRLPPAPPLKRNTSMMRPPINPETGKLSKRGDVVFEVWNWSLEDFQEEVRQMSNNELRSEREVWYFKKSDSYITEDTAKYLICDDEYQRRGLSENTMKLSKRQLRRIIRETIEGLPPEFQQISPETQKDIKDWMYDDYDLVEMVVAMVDSQVDPDDFRKVMKCISDPLGLQNRQYLAMDVAIRIYEDYRYPPLDTSY